MHAYLIIGANTKLIDQEVEKVKKENEINQLIPFTLAKIEDSKNLKKLTKFSYFNKTCFVIRDIDITNNETLNSLLKNLEEPSQNIFYILTAKSIEAVLPTIASRCQIIKVTETKNEIKNEKQITTFLSSDLIKKFEIIKNIKEREMAIEFINDLIQYDYKKKELVNMENYLKILKNLKSNGNVSLQLANLVARMNLAYGKK